MSGLGDRTLSGITGPGLMRRSLGVVRVDLALSMVTALVRQLAFLAIPWVLGRAVDAVVQDKDIDSTARWAGLLILVVLAESAGIIGWSWWSGLAHARMAAELRRRILGHVVTLDEGSYGAAGFGVGDVSIRGSRDVDSIGLWVRGLATWVVIGTTFVVLLPAMFALDPMLLVVTLAVIPLLIAVNVVMPPWFRLASNLLAASHSARADAVQELLTATLPVRGIGGEAALLARHHRHSEVVTERALGAGRVGGVWSAVASFVPKAAVVAGVAVGGFAVAEGRVGVGALTTFALWMATITLATQVLVDRLSERGDAGVAARRVAEVFALRGTVPEPSHPVSLPAGGALDAHEVVCRRDGRIVCGPISLRVEPGTWLAISGVSGSGKTTLLRVLRRAADPSSGVVRVGGVALNDVTSDDIRARVALVAQRPTLFSGTLANNLCPDGDRTDDEIRRACRVAAFDSVVDESPDGLSTAVGENGVTLSGGQRQRLAIARAVLTDPHVILLDDATSALDVPTERLVLDRLREWSAGRVVVFASHRDAVSAAADHHLELPAPPAVTDADRIVEVGTGVDVAR